MLKISIAMAVYNGEKYLQKQLDSIKSQSLSPFEIVIVDDNSTDLTPKIIEDFAKNSNLNIKFYKNEKNIGFAENFKKALFLTSGDVCLLCDQDDIWETDKIKEMSKIFADSSVSGCAAGFRFIDENDDFLNNDMQKPGVYAFLDAAPKNNFSKIPFKNIVRRNIAPGCTCGYRKNIVDLFIENGTAALPHDYQLAAISSALDGFYYYNIPLTRYRIHSENTLGLKPINQTRLDIAGEKLNLSNVVKNVSVLGKEYNEISDKRFEFLSKKEPLKILSLFSTSQYKEYYNFKERLGDVIYAVK